MKKSLGSDTFVYPTPVWVIATYGKDGKPNAATASWAGVCCSNPPSVNVSFRKATLTYHNIMTRRAFTVNIPSEDWVIHTDYLGIASGKKQDKFAVTGLTPVKSEVVDAPYIQEFPLALECEVTHITPIGLHTMFIAKIVDVKADESILGEDGQPDINKIKPFIYEPIRHDYHRLGDFIGKVYKIGKKLGKS